MKSIISKYIPRPIKEEIIKFLRYQQLKRNYNFDMKRYFKYAFELSRNESRRHHETDLIFYYHKIEKGLSLPTPRIGFGKHYVYHLLSLLEKYNAKYGWDNVSKVSLNTLYAYYYFNERNNLRLPDLFKRIEALNSTINDDKLIIQGGVEEVTRTEIDKSNINFKNFAYTRYSIRNFAPGEISNELLKEAVHIAQKTPSVCNRQSWKVYVYNETRKQDILKFQNGNAGFGEDANKIIIVTSELKDFRGVKERNQSYIDGGLYSMSLIYALHSLGVGTCPLNLCLDYKTEMKLKETAGISDSEVLLMMIAVGNIPEKLKVASSPRRTTDEVLTIM